MKTIAIGCFFLLTYQMQALHTAELVLKIEKDLLVAESCPCVLRIKQSTYWAADDNDSEETPNEFYYDIAVDYDNWLLAGKRRLRFQSKVPVIFTVSYSVYLIHFYCIAWRNT